jgi:hypothetical protein
MNGNRLLYFLFEFSSYKPVSLNQPNSHEKKGRILLPAAANYRFFLFPIAGN